MAGIAFLFKQLDQLIDGLGLFCLAVEPAMEELEKDPLGPFVVMGIGGLDLAAPIVTKADIIELLAKVLDIVVSRNSGMDAHGQWRIVRQGGQMHRNPWDEYIEPLSLLNRAKISLAI